MAATWSVGFITCLGQSETFFVPKFSVPLWMREVAR